MFKQCKYAGSYPCQRQKKRCKRPKDECIRQLISMYKGLMKQYVEATLPDFYKGGKQYEDGR